MTGGRADEASEIKDEAFFGPSVTELVSMIADGVISCDENGRIVLFNSAAEEIFGFQQQDVIGRSLSLLIPARLQADHERHVRDFAGGSPRRTKIMGHRREVLGRRQNGEEFAIEASLSRRVIQGRTILTAVVRDVSERKRLEDERQLLAGELAHRFKNMMTVVNSIVSLSAKGNPSATSFEQELRGRLHALGRTHEILGEPTGGAVALSELLESELSPYRDAENENITLAGPEVILPFRVTVTLALVLHELTTNAVKYGGLSRAGGHVSASWEIVAPGVEDGSSSLLLNWVESGGPPVVPPRRRGFGTTLIERSLGSGVTLNYRSAGLEARLEIPLDAAKSALPRRTD